MSSIFGILNIGKLALSAEQKALSVTSQNIANVNTPGYARQEAVFETTVPLDGAPGQVGTGVRIGEVRRMIDLFIESQVTAGASNLGRLEVDQRTLSRIEALFSDAEGTGIGKTLSEFFAALQDLANHPQGAAERTALLEQSKTLAARFVSIDTEMRQIQKDLDGEIKGVIGDVNDLATRIADLNGEIARAELSGQKANDLRDERGRLLNDLSGKIEIQSFENDRGEVSVFIAGGKPLVESNNASLLRAVPNGDNNGFSGVVFDSGGSTVDITASLAGGRLKGLVDLRDNTIPGYIDRLDQLAAGMVNEVNRQHRVGFGLDGSTGRDFFSPLAPTVLGQSANTGVSTVTATVNDPSLLTFDSYRLTFAGGNYTVQNLRTGASATGVYADPTTVLFEGLQVNITGAPAAGDRFDLSAHQGTAGSMGVALTDPNRVAASSSSAGVPGNNGNALLLAQLQEKGVTGFSGATVQEFYSRFVGEVGVRSQSAQRSLSAEKVIQEQLSNRREEVSGVSLDEEMANLIKFQRAFQAAARLITTADELFQTLLGMKR